MVPKLTYFLNKRSGAMVMSSDSEGLGTAVEAGVGSNELYFIILLTLFF